MKIQLTLSILIITSVCFAQPSDPHDPEPSYSEEEKEVLAVVLELFEGYRNRDATRVGATLSADGNMQRVTIKDGKSIVTPSSSLAGFVKYVASGLTQKHDEPLWDTKVHVDGDLASVWTKYAFYLEGKFHHCGSENFLLHKENDEWKIFHLVDTSQTEGCVIPEKIKASSEF